MMMENGLNMKTCSEEGAVVVETFGPDYVGHSVAYDSRNDTWLVQLIGTHLEVQLFNMLMFVLKNPGSRLSHVASCLGSDILAVQDLYNKAILHGFIRVHHSETPFDPELYPTFKLRSYLYRVVREKWVYDYDVVDGGGIFYQGWDDVF